MGKHSGEQFDKANRIPVSMRLPFEIVETVEEYAAKNGLRKTDAYLHFLQRGVEVEASDLIIDRMDALEEKIDAMAALIQAQSNMEMATEKVAVELSSDENPTERLELQTGSASVREEAPTRQANATPLGEEAAAWQAVAIPLGEETATWRATAALESEETFENEEPPTGETFTNEMPAGDMAPADFKPSVSEQPAAETSASDNPADAKEPTESEIERVRVAVEKVAPRYPAILQVYLFGSVARGTANEESNIDLKLELDSRKTLDSQEIATFCADIGQLAGREVDVITTLLLHNKPLVEAYEREKVLVYERSQRLSLPSI